MEIILPVLKFGFREYCVHNFVVPEIEDLFRTAGIRRGALPADRRSSGQKRAMVERYYASIDWSDESDVDRFVKVLGYALERFEPGRHSLRQMCETSGLLVKGNVVQRWMR